MSSSKYCVCKTKTGKTKKEIVKGAKKVCYNKKGSVKMYVKSKGRMMSLTKYKKMKSKQSGGEIPFIGKLKNLLSGGKRKSKKIRKRKN